ncbi:hypothetical protein LTR56_013780 [Elasticomyces elasticus]|nr:hypothetical protein LTR56_013780 [Elasticomyces elasticus]KAK3647468.1 hypothetical protein LTR22_013761 [Elasticomyces elasticus]KAK4907104.1 hypothetical protein LTR49_023847 [Elasticomyces elasticus]KAK5755264.1 hypothetical protein LTS12_014603 [Elasticomyces elasticus]
MQDMPMGDFELAVTPHKAPLISYQIILSSALIVYGTQHAQVSTTRRGYSMYGESLVRLNEALSDPRCHTRDEMLAPTDPETRLKHTIGLERLVELRGPQAYCASQPEVFNCVATMLLDASLRTETSSIFAREDWKVALRARCQDDAMADQELHDLFANCTVLAARRSARQLELERGTGEQKALAIRADVFAWRDKWQIYPRSVRVEDSALDVPNMVDVGLKVYEFPRERAALTYMMYNTVLLHVQRILASHTEQQPEPASSPSTGSGTQSDIHPRPCEYRRNLYMAQEIEAALEICRCIPYYLNTAPHKTVGFAAAFIWAMMGAWETLRGRDTSAGRWMLGVLNSNGGQDLTKLL